VQQHFVTRAVIVAQVFQHRENLVARHPQRWHAFGRVLADESGLAELLVEVGDYRGELACYWGLSHISQSKSKIGVRVVFPALVVSFSNIGVGTMTPTPV